MSDASGSPGPSESVAGSTPPRRGKDRPPSDLPPEEQVFLCDLCGNEMLNIHCKLTCEQCGYKRDCSDP